MKSLVILCLFYSFYLEEITASQQYTKLPLDIQGNLTTWTDHEGKFLLSNNSKFTFGFENSSLVVMHRSSKKIVWTANPSYQMTTDDVFNFTKDGNVVLLSKGNKVVWSTNTSNKGAVSLELQNTGNLVVLDKESKPLWQSFQYPTDTLLSEQIFVTGMKLISNSNDRNSTYHLEIKNGDMFLFLDSQSNKPYWSMMKDKRITNGKRGQIQSAILDYTNFWKLYENNSVISQFQFWDINEDNHTRAVTIGNDGFMTFSILQDGNQINPTTKIPENLCQIAGNCSQAIQEQHSGTRKHGILIPVIVPLISLVAASTLLLWWLLKRRRGMQTSSSQNQHMDEDDEEEEETFIGTITGMPSRFCYKDLYDATCGFSVKLGQGGFGSVYHGILPDQTPIAVKKLDGVGQGIKEFRTEVSIIGSIHHVNLVQLRGFCAQGNHRLLAYEYMSRGSLDRWIFPNKTPDFLIDWDKRFQIALDIAKGLAYLHENCNAKIIHCDIKPENVLLDENFNAKLSDFGLAKLMTKEESKVFTTLRGTRGYLAPEWITNCALSEKSDVYSYGIVLLEMIGGRKNCNPDETSEKVHLLSYAFKKLEEGNLEYILDSKLKYDRSDERIPLAVKVALWCTQENVNLRPSMTSIVQMLEGVIDVPKPPFSYQLSTKYFSNLFQSSEGTCTSSSDYEKFSVPSAVNLSSAR